MPGCAELRLAALATVPPQFGITGFQASELSKVDGHRPYLQPPKRAAKIAKIRVNEHFPYPADHYIDRVSYQRSVSDSPGAQGHLSRLSSRSAESPVRMLTLAALESAETGNGNRCCHPVLLAACTYIRSCPRRQRVRAIYNILLSSIRAATDRSSCGIGAKMSTHNSTKDLIEISPQSYRGESIDLYVNSTCNLKCTTCFLGEAYFSRRIDMSLETATAIMRWASAARVSDVAFLGGEPSLHPQIDTFLRTARSTGIPINRFITNGTPPFRRLLKRVPELLDRVYVSLDGPTEEINDLVRGRGTYRQAMETIKILRHHGIDFTITSSITPRSVASLPALLQLGEDSGCRVMNIHWVSPTGRAAAGIEPVGKSEWIEVYHNIMNYRPNRADYTVQCQAAYLMQQDLDRRFSPILDPRACSVRSFTNLQFMPDSRVHACGLTVDSPGTHGYVWQDGRLYRRTSPSELSQCDTIESGCPLRLDGKTKEVLPICIYQRVENAMA